MPAIRLPRIVVAERAIAADRTMPSRARIWPLRASEIGIATIAATRPANTTAIVMTWNRTSRFTAGLRRALRRTMARAASHAAKEMSRTAASGTYSTMSMFTTLLSFP